MKGAILDQAIGDAIMATFAELYEALVEFDEGEKIEAKESREAGRSLLETVCAFANEPGLDGGHILLGVARDESSLVASYEVVGVTDPDRLQSDLASRLRSEFNRPVHARITPERYKGKVVLLVHVPEAHPKDKPIYFKKIGLPRGAYRRLGASDVACTEDDLRVFYQDGDNESYDSKVVEDTAWEDVDPDAVSDYRRVIEESRPGPDVLDRDDRELLRSLRCAKFVDGEFRLTLAGLLLFGKATAQRRCLPMTRVDTIRVPGRDWERDPDAKFIASERRGPVVRLARQVWSDVLDDIPRSFRLPSESIEREEKGLVPDRVIREAVVNALMHRDYRVNAPIQIIRYSNRLEFRNPGYSLKSEEHLGEPGSEPRNPCIAAVLYEMRLAETKGRGFSIMRERMRKEGLSPPPFDSSRSANRFALFLLFHHLLSDEDLRWLSRFHDLNLTDEERQVLVVTRETGAMDNRVFRYISGASPQAARRSLRKLSEAGLLAPKGRGSGSHYVPTDKLLLGRAELSGRHGSTPPKSEAEPGWTPPDNAPTPPDYEAESGRTPPDNPPTPPDNAPTPPDNEAERGRTPPDNTSPPAYATALEEGESDASFTGEWGPMPERIKQLPKSLQKIPGELLTMVEGLGRRARTDDVRAVILALCAWRDLKAAEIARILGRDPKYIGERYLGRMISSGELVYTIPDIESHMNQAYRTPRTG